MMVNKRTEQREEQSLGSKKGQEIEELTDGAMIGLDDSNEMPILTVSNCVTMYGYGAHGDLSFLQRCKCDGAFEWLAMKAERVPCSLVWVFAGECGTFDCDCDD